MALTRFSLAVATTLAATAISGIALAADVGAAGQFVGASGHVTRGNVQIVKDGADNVVRFGPHFALDNGPDPKVGFGKDGKFVSGTLIGALQSLDGGQSYRVPASLDISGYDEVYIWCERFSVPLGVAKLN